MRKREAVQPRKCYKWKPRQSSVSQAAMLIRYARMCKFHRGFRAWRAHKVVHTYLGDLISSISFVVGGLKLGHLGENPMADQKSDCLIVAMKFGNKNGRSQGGNSMVVSAEGNMYGTRGREA